MALGDSFRSVLLAAQAGEEWAVDRLYRDLSGAVLRYLIVHDAQEAEDLASETWIDVARALPRFEGAEDDLRRFVFAIAKRRLVDHRRKLHRRNTHATPQDAIEPHLPTGDVESEVMDRFSTRGALERITEVLSPDQAEVVVLRVIGGFSANEVARLMGKRPVTVRVLQHRALARLAAHFAEFDVTTEQLRTM